MRIKCQCGKLLQINEQLEGRRVRCPGCGRVVREPEGLPPLAREPKPGISKRTGPTVQTQERGQTQPRSTDDAEQLHPSPPSYFRWIIVGISGGAAVLILVILGFVFLWKPDQGKQLPQDGDKLVGHQPKKQPQFLPEKQVQEAKPVPRLEAPTQLSKLAHVRDVTFSSDGKLLATVQYFGNGTVYNVLQIWDLASGEQLFKLHEDNFQIDYPVFSHDGRLVACFFGSWGQVKVWDLRSGKLVRQFHAPKDMIFQEHLLDFSPDGQHVFAATETDIYRLSIADGRVRMLEGVALNRDDRMAAMPTTPFLAVGGKSLVLVDQMTGAGKPAFALSGTTVAMNSSKDGKTLALAYVQGHIDVFNTDRWNVRTTLKREQKDGFHFYAHIELSRDGKTLLGVPRFQNVGGYFGRVEIWEIATGKMHNLDFEAFHKLAYAPDGNTIAIALHHAQLLLIDAKTGKQKSPENSAAQKGKAN